MTSERILIFGASRGLGAEMVRHLANGQSNLSILGVARKEALLKILEKECGSKFSSLTLDLSHLESRALIEKSIFDFNPTRVFYVAGGGPFGPYGERSFDSHQWAWRVTFETPAFIAHQLLKKGSLTPLIFIGSSVCEGSGDPQASSYAAAKHALLGLFRSLKLEEPHWDLRMFSPGYMDTALLPANASVRSKPLWNPKVVAEMLLEWAFDPLQVEPQKSLPPFPKP